MSSTWFKPAGRRREVPGARNPKLIWVRMKDLGIRVLGLYLSLGFQDFCIGYQSSGSMVLNLQSLEPKI